MDSCLPSGKNQGSYLNQRILLKSNYTQVRSQSRV